MDGSMERSRLSLSGGFVVGSSHLRKSLIAALLGIGMI
jgi:hypothetical protein